MSLEALIGSQLVLGIPGTEAAPDVIAAFRETQAQSLILFTRNHDSPEQVIALVHDLNEALGRRLLVMVDHEGGRIMRFPHWEAITHFPDALTMGRTQGEEQVERQGRTEAEELRQLGIHVNLAPCVDVLVEGSDAVIGDRSYGSDPELVTRLSLARIRGLQSGHVAACAKHFPGLGAVPRDPHKVLPTITLDWTALEEIHLVPFQRVMEAGVATVMSSHVCYPGLGEPDGWPATFSPKLIRGLLRDRFGYEGLVLTDALEMGALRQFGTIGEAAVRAAEAGHDMFLICCPELDAGREAAKTLRRAYESGRLPQAELEASASRVERLRVKFVA